MIVSEETVTIETEGLTVDLIVWRKFRRPMPGYVEKVLDLNPEVAGVIEPIPVGATLFLPATESKTSLPDVPAISLWE